MQKGKIQELPHLLVELNKRDADYTVIFLGHGQAMVVLEDGKIIPANIRQPVMQE